jgi:class 3 adenylate cyclase/pimeloyl-ACP methyl ester carboxylesterase
VSIAFWTLGEGLPVVQMPTLPWSHVQLEWQDPGWRRWYERGVEKRKLVRYDGRGTGLSDREVADYSLEAHMLDLQAVVERLGMQRFVLLGPFAAGPIAVTYSARHPEAVSHLILWCAWARAPRELRAFRMLADQGWKLFTESLAHASFGWSAGEEAHRYAAFLRQCVTAEAGRAILDALLEFDVTPVLSQVRSPTLILHRRQTSALGARGVEVAKGLASGIPDARLALLEGASFYPWVGDEEAVRAAIDEFLGDSEPAPAGAEAPAGGFCTILFTDVESSTALTQRLGDAGAREVLREHERIVREALKSHGGSEVKALGDGFMASFSSATRALECAIATQRAFAEHNESNPDTPIRVRIGLNAGEPIAEEEDLFGTAVNLAARIAAQAAGGEILVANVIRELAAGKGFLFADRGETALRGFEDPVRLFEARWREG